MELDYYDDSEEEFDDSLYYVEEEQIEERETVKEQNLGILNADLITTILLCAEMSVTVKIGSISKSVRKLCTPHFWTNKLQQYGIEHVPSTFTDCVALYRQHMINTNTYRKVDTFINSLRLSPKINLQLSLSNKKLDELVSKSGYYHKRVGVVVISRKYLYNLTIHACKSEDRTIPLIDIDLLYKLTIAQFREFIFHLFFHGYLDERWVYLK